MIPAALGAWLGFTPIPFHKFAFSLFMMRDVISFPLCSECSTSACSAACFQLLNLSSSTHSLLGEDTKREPSLCFTCP